MQLDQAVHTRLREANNLLLLGAKRTYLGGVGDGDSVRDIWAYQALFLSEQCNPAPAGPTEETELWRCGASDLWQAAWNLPGTAQPNVRSAVGGSSPRQTDRADRQAAYGRHKCES